MEDDKTIDPKRPGAALHRRSRAIATVAALVAASAVGAGATVLTQGRRSVTLLALAPQPIATLKDGSPAALKGEVAEIFGDKFVVQDASGRALVETGPRGASKALVSKGETVAVQGRFDDGSLHAEAVTHTGGRIDVLDPPPPRPMDGDPGARRPT